MPGMLINFSRFRSRHRMTGTFTRLGRWRTCTALPRSVQCRCLMTGMNIGLRRGHRCWHGMSGMSIRFSHRWCDGHCVSGVGLPIMRGLFGWFGYRYYMPNR